jgi:hypothetical protein
MTRERGREIGWEWFKAPPAAAGTDLCCYCGDECSGEGYLEMEGDYWSCPACFAKLPDPEERAEARAEEESLA